MINTYMLRAADGKEIQGSTPFIAMSDAIKAGAQLADEWDAAVEVIVPHTETWKVYPCVGGVRRFPHRILPVAVIR